MTRRETINANTHPLIAQRFRETAGKYGNRIGMCLTAAMAMFMEADPRVQAEFIKRVFDAQLHDEVEAFLEELRRTQAERACGAADRPQKKNKP